MDPNNLPKFVYLHKNHKFRLKLGFYAAPSNPKTFSKSIKDELQKLKFTFCSDLNGLIMGFGKISSNELIPADIRHCISVGVNVDVFIFRPPIGSTIEAVVNQTSDSHISCLVHNLFNVSIMRPDNQPFNNWSGSKIKKDDKIHVKFLSFDHTKKLPHITGDIVINNKNECNNFKDEQHHSSIKSLNDKNSKNIMKQIEKRDPYSSSSDSESSDEIKHTTFSKTDDIFTKTPSSFKNSRDEQDISPVKSVNDNNTKNVMKPIEKKDNDSSSSDSESSDEIKHTTFSKTDDIFTKTSSSFKNSRDKQDISPVKSINDENTKNVMKPIEKKDTDSSSSDSESSNKNKHNAFSKSNDGFTKTSPSCQVTHKDSKYEQDYSSIKLVNDNNTKNVMKPIEKKDTDNSSSDSEYSDEIKHNTFSKTHNIFTTSPLFQGKGRDSKDEQDNSSMKYLSLIESTNEENAKNDHKKKEKEDNDNSSCDSESSYETKLIHTLDNRTHINGPLFSSTPNSDHTINNIGLGRNKLQEQLRKHLAKNKITKQKSFDSVKSPSKLIKDNHSQYNNITKDIKIDENESNITATLVDNNQNIDIMDNMKLQNNMQSDSVINSNNLKKKKFSINNSIKCSPIKLKKSTKKNQNSNVSVGTILNYFSPDKDKCTTNVTKNNLSIDCNADHVKNNEVKNTMYKQEKHDSISPGNTDPDKLNNFKSPCKPIVKFLSKMTLNTKNFSPKNKDIIVDSKNKIENKLLQNKSNIKLSLISDSECSNSDIEDDVRSIIDFEHETNCNKQIQNKKVDNIPVLTKSNRSIQYASSSDDEIYTKLRQNISKIENKTITCEQIKNQPFHEMYSSDDTSVSSSKSLQLNTTKINSINTFETHRCNIINNKFLNEKQNKVSMVNEESTNLQSSKCTNDKSKLLPNISCEKNNKIDLIKRILNEGSSSNDEINSKPLQIITNEIEKPNINDTRQISTSNVLKLNENTKTELNKDIVNPFIESHTQNISSISVDDASNFKSTKDKTKTYKPIKNQQFHELHSSDDESVSSFKLHGTSLKTLQSNTLKVNYVNEINTENCNIMSDKLLNKNSLKKQYKTLPVNEESTILQSPKFSDDKSKLLSNIMNCENNSKIDLIKKILEDSSSDNDINLKPSQIKIPDKSEINKSCSNQMPTSSVLKLNDNTKVLNENIVNPFIKFYTKNTSSSSEEDGSIIKLTKSKKNYSSKKKIVPSVKQEEDHKNVLINQLLSSIKHKEKKPKKKFFSEQINCNASLCRKPAKSKESKEDELKVKTKSKKDVLKKVITPVGESKSNKLTLDNTPNNIMLPSKIYISSNDGTDDEIDLIKKMMKSRKLKIKNDRSESIFSNNILTKPDKINATSEKTNRNFKSCKTPTILTNELISNNTKLKKKRPIESKDLLLNSILNSLGSSSDHYPPTKKKKKNEIIQLTDEFKDDYSEKSLSKSKKKKKDHNLVIEINEKNSGQLLSMSKKKKKNLDLVFEVNDKTKNKISNESIAKSKTKKKNHNLVIEINDEFKEKNSGQHLSMSKKKKNHDLVFEVNDKTKNKISNESIAKSKSKKKDHNLAIEINDTLKDKISDPSLAKFKKKKKNHSLVIETNDESKDKTSDQKASKSKKRKKNQNLVIDTNDELIDKNVFELKKKKKEKTKNSNYDILVKENKSQCYDSPAISHNELIREENLPIDVTKKKKKKKEVKKDSLLSDTQNPSITDILSTFEVELEDRNLNSQKEKKKKKKK